ncbi:MAG: chromosomal replication initiator protein DnaA [Clostridia bacterium]|nr:chromosomal replication initiator protein DnaA [Clostridia bacterium]
MNNLLSRWNDVLKDMENLVTAVSYDLYIETLEPIKVDKNKLIVLASTSTNKNQLIKLHKEKLLNVVKTHFDNIEDVVVLEPSEKEAFLEEIKENEEFLETNQMMNIKNKLNEKYTFESFVVGKSNQFVYAAARSVAENPGKKYNPLFIYGGVGLGKTHLLHAIGNYIKKNNKNIRILYVTSEQFTNDYIQALKADRKENANKAFRDKYREVDVLMIDDIQFIANKTSTQEEFFHTFNDLYQLDKQIVISSDKHPRNMETLEERLKSRFTGGLIQDIQKPDYETRLAILQKKVETENYNVNSDVLEFLAEKINTNIRELEGSLNKVVSLSSLIGKDKATMFEAEEALKDITAAQGQNLSVEKIMDTVCKYYDVKKVDLIGKKKNKEIVDPRQICIYLITELMDIPLITIGNAFGGRDHTTVIHARDKISQNIKTDKSLKTNIDDIIAMIKSDIN